MNDIQSIQYDSLESPILVSFVKHKSKTWAEFLTFTKYKLIKIVTKGSVNLKGL